MSHETEILAPQSNVSSVSLLAPRVPIAIRVATIDDLPFVDALQKKHHKQLGFFPRAQMEEYIRNQWILIAEAGSPVGYIAWRDRYQKRDELGAIFQLCVDDSARRKLVGAMLVREAFERSAYGCKLFCCWCAQDVAANRFWEAMGFVPLAFRAGGRACPEHRRRVHIFWQRRIRAGDTTTPYWFPSQTGGGSIREDRLVLPIPPGTHWSDEMPRVLPAMSRVEGPGESREERAKALPAPRERREKGVPATRSTEITSGGLRFFVPNQPQAQPKPKREKKPKQKNDPKLVAAARELRDRWLEQVNAGQYLPEVAGKYDVGRVLVDARETAVKAVRGLPILDAPIAA